MITNYNFNELGLIDDLTYLNSAAFYDDEVDVVNKFLVIIGKKVNQRKKVNIENFLLTKYNQLVAAEDHEKLAILQEIYDTEI